MAKTGMTVGLINALTDPVDPAVITEAVEGWLDDHPEATTTVEDGSITKAKLDSNLAGAIDDVGDLKTEIDDLSTATSLDVGKALSPKTVSDGKVTEWQYKAIGGGTVEDVQVNATSIVDGNGVAEIPVADANMKLGLVQWASNGFYGVVANNTGRLYIYNAPESDIKAGTSLYKPITPSNQDAASFYGLAKAAGDSTQSASANAVGTYTDAAKSAIQSMLGIPDALNETTEAVIEIAKGTDAVIGKQFSLRNGTMRDESKTKDSAPYVNGTSISTNVFLGNGVPLEIHIASGYVCYLIIFNASNYYSSYTSLAINQGIATTETLSADRYYCLEVRKSDTSAISVSTFDKANLWFGDKYVNTYAQKTYVDEQDDALEAALNTESAKRYDFDVEVINPYCTPHYEGNKIITSPENLSFKGIFVKFDSIIIKSRTDVITKTWSDLKNDLGNVTFVGPDYTPDVLLLNLYSYGYQGLYYNLDTNHFFLQTSNVLLTANCICLGFPKNGTGYGIIFDKALLKADVSDDVYTRRIRRDLLPQIRENEVALLGVQENFSMILSTDVHYFLIEHMNIQNVTNAVVKELDDNFHADALINCGDSMLYGTKFKQYGLTALLNIFREIDNDRLVYAVGNHDFNSVADGGTTNKEDWIITDSELTSLINRHAKATSRPSGKLYYYRDYTEKKTRIIVLNTMDVPFEFNVDGTIKYDPVNVHGIRQAQYDWLIETLNSVQAGWKVVVCMHVGSYIESDGFTGNTDTFLNRTCLNAILKAYKTKGSYSTTYTDTTYSGLFTVSLSGSFSTANGNLIAVFSGHAHNDGYCSSDGFNAIQTTCSYPNQNTRIPGTYDEFSVDFIVLDDEQQKIIIKRFGLGNDREYDYDPQ